MALRSNAMGLRSLSVVAGVDETSTASQPYCHCHLLSTDPPPGGKRRAVSVSSSAADHHNQRVHCQCGEWRQPRLVWTWDTQIGPHHPAVRFEGQHQQHVVFHPVFSSGTSVVRSAEPLLRGAINYFEVKVLTPLTGTDVMLGIGTQRVAMRPPDHHFVSHLGLDDQSWGYSYRGVVQHGGVQRKYGRRRFSIGCIVGVLADLRHGTVEFYLNRKPLGIAYRNVPADEPIYAYATSTAAKSEIRLIHASRHECNLQYLSFRAIARCPQSIRRVRRIPGLRHRCAELFFLHSEEMYAYWDEPIADRRTLDEEALLSCSTATATAKRTAAIRPRGHLDDVLLAQARLGKTEVGNGSIRSADENGKHNEEEEEFDIYSDLRAHDAEADDVVDDILENDRHDDESDEMSASPFENQWAALLFCDHA